LDAVEDDLRAAGQDVTDLLNHFAGEEEAVIGAANYPDPLLDCATMHGTDPRRRLIAERVELAFTGSLRRLGVEFAQLARHLN
jgi:hypothetical protein